jgi:hypothetical protein
VEDTFYVGAINAHHWAPPRYSYDSAGPQPFKSDKVYVSPGIVEYSRAANLPLENYCKTLEPHLGNLNPEFIPYNPQNPQHVSDVITEGYYLLNTEDKEDPMVKGIHKATTDATSHWHKSPEPEPFQTPQGDKEDWAGMRENPDKDRTIKALASAGIIYEKNRKFKDLFKDEDSELLKVRYLE